MLTNVFLSDCVKITAVNTGSTAATSAVNSTAVDMTTDGGWDAVQFICIIGTAAANNIGNVAQSSDNSSYDDLAGTALNGGASGLVLVSDIIKPTDQWVRFELARGTSTTVQSIVALQYRAKRLGFSQPSTVTLEQHNQPIEGTA